MRLIMTSAAAMAATLSLSVLASASPLDWPDAHADQSASMALHCAAVLHAYGNAYAFAADLTGQSAPPLGGLPAPLLQLAGGPARLPDIAQQAQGYQAHAESVARTSFYPTLVGDGTPYLADDGRELMLAVQTCVAQFGL